MLLPCWLHPPYGGAPRVLTFARVPNAACTESGGRARSLAEVPEVAREGVEERGGGCVVDEASCDGEFGADSLD